MDRLTPFSEFRLPPGRHGASAEEVAENQRWRLLGAAAEVLAEQGHVRTTSTRIARRASVSPATFYKHFDNVAECLLAAYVAAADAVVDICAQACEEDGIGWLHRLGVAVGSTLRLLAGEPATANLLGSEAPSGEVAIAIARQGLVDRLAELLASGRALRPEEAPELPAHAERHLISGAIAVISERVAAGEAERLPEVGPEIVEMLSAPYVS